MCMPGEVLKLLSEGGHVDSYIGCCNNHCFPGRAQIMSAIGDLASVHSLQSLQGKITDYQHELSTLQNLSREQVVSAAKE